MAAKALELVFTGEMVGAEEALRIGLFNRVVPGDELDTATRELAATLARKPPIALALAKAAISGSGERDLSGMLDVELENQLRCFQSADGLEGLDAFLRKREPVFRGI